MDQGPMTAENAQPSVSEVYDAIDNCRVRVMALYGGNLDHPAIDHLEAAMASVMAVQGEVARAQRR